MKRRKIEIKKSIIIIITMIITLVAILSLSVNTNIS